VRLTGENIKNKEISLFFVPVAKFLHLSIGRQKDNHSAVSVRERLLENPSIADEWNE